MSVAYGKGDKGKATKLHAKITRSVGFCENCYKTDGQLQTAHIISRRYSRTRTMLNNAFCLCASCHRWFTDNPKEFAQFVDDTWAGEIYRELYELAHAMTAKVQWADEVERLKKLDIDNVKKARELEAQMFWGSNEEKWENENEPERGEEGGRRVRITIL